MKRLCSVNILIFLVLAAAIEFPIQAKGCPDPEKLVETSLNDSEDLFRALETIVPDLYKGKEFSKWEAVSITPFPLTVGKQDEEIYFQIAKNYCGGKVAEKSWLVRLHFPKMETGSASMSEGQLFVSKSKESDWFVWYQYH